MPPRKRAGRPQTGRAAREAGDEQVQPAIPPAVAPQIDQDALRQMVQDAARQAAQVAVQQVAQEAARQAAQEAARVAAQEVARQMAAFQQGQQGPQIHVQGGPQVQVQQNQQIPGQQAGGPQVPLQQVPPQHHAQGVEVPLPPPPYVHPGYDRFYRLTSQMKNMDMEHFSGATDPTKAYDWKLSLVRKLENIECPPEYSLRLTMQYLRGDALVWWEGVRMNNGPGILTFDDFTREFDRKYFPKEAMDKKKSDFEHVSQGNRTIREYEVEFNKLRRFAGTGISEEDLIRKFLDGMRVDIRNRCRVVTYHRIGDLVEKAAEQEAGLAEEQKVLKAAQAKSGKTSEIQKRTWDQTGAPNCGRCHRYHFGECFQCRNCGKYGHAARNCRVRPSGTQAAATSTPAAPAATVAPAAAAAVARGPCYTCNQHGHISRDCPNKGPPAKRQAIAPRVYALGETEGAEPIAGMFLFPYFLLSEYFVCRMSCVVRKIIV